MNQLDYLAHPPPIQPITKIITPLVHPYKSFNDIPVYEVRKEACGVVLVEIVFKAGRPQERKKLVAAATGALLREGAGLYSADVLSEEIDFMGATLSTRASMDYITIKGVCLKKQLPRLIDIMGAVVSEPHLSDVEWSHYRDKSKERLQVQLSKPDVLSYRTITEAIYGSNHPYGYNSSPELYDAVTSDDLRAHQQEFMTAPHCKIFLSGDICDNDRNIIDGLCKRLKKSSNNVGVTSTPQLDTSVPSRKTVRRVGSQQTSLRLGRLACTRRDADFDALNYVCNILGGYFGSRLITRLREDRGLTYSIYCTVDSQVYEGDIMISTEVANENVNECLEQIYHEMSLLAEELVSDEELELVNNYMMGNYLNLFDGPFNSIRAIKSLALADIPLDELDTLIKSSLSFDAYQVRDIARKYFNRNDFWEVIVGTPQE